MNIDASSISGIIDTIEDLAIINRELCVNTKDNSRAIGDISGLYHSHSERTQSVEDKVEHCSERMQCVENEVGYCSERMQSIGDKFEQLAGTIAEILKCERTALEKFGNLASRLEQPVSTGIDFGQRSSQ